MIEMEGKGCSRWTLHGDRIKSSGGDAIKDILGGRMYTTGQQGMAVRIAVGKKSLSVIMTLNQRHPGCQRNGIMEKIMAFLQKQ